MLQSYSRQRRTIGCFSAIADFLVIVSGWSWVGDYAVLSRDRSRHPTPDNIFKSDMQHRPVGELETVEFVSRNCRLLARGILQSAQVRVVGHHLH